MATVLATDLLSRSFGKVEAVRGVSFSVDEGALFGLLGPNGSGKTTMVKMLTGQIRPTSGSSNVLGMDPAASPIKVREKIGIIPEQETPPSFLTAEEYLHFVGEVRKIPGIEKKADWWFRYLEFEEKHDVLCKDLSRGTRQKLMLAQAFLHDPILAIIDEPLINFDPIMQQKVKEFLADYVKKGNTIFICTHILEIAEEICSDIAILNRGNLLHYGKTKDILQNGRHLQEFFLEKVGRGTHA